MLFSLNFSQLQATAVIWAAQLIDTCTTNTIANVQLVGDLDVEILVALTSTMSSVVGALALDHTRDIGLSNRKNAIDKSLGAVLRLLQVRFWHFLVMNKKKTFRNAVFGKLGLGI